MKQLPVPGIILAAGQSRRMGNTNKLLLKFHDKPLLLHVVDTALASKLSPLILVVSQDIQDFLDNISLQHIKIIVNPTPDKGYASSLQAGLTLLPPSSTGAMFLLADQPLVTVQTINLLISTFQKEPHSWVAPLYKGQRGNPVIIPATWFHVIQALTGDRGPGIFFSNSKVQRRFVDVDDRGVVFDVDSPRDFTLLQTLSSKG